MNLEKRFWSKVCVGKEDECWNWKASSRSSGYGSFKYSGKVIDSHRMTWFIINGEFPNMFVLHMCDNKLCCNPNHLFLGTHVDNMKDMVSKGRSASGEKSGVFLYSKLKKKDVLEIRSKYLTGNYSYKELGKMFGVDKTQIGGIVRRKHWKHI